MKAKRILLLANEYTTILNFRMELIRALNADGHKVFVAIPDNENNKDISAAGCTIINYNVSRKGRNPLKEMQVIKQIKFIFNSVKPDIVFTFTIKPNIYGGIVCTKKGIPYVANITGLGTAIECRGVMQKIALRLYKKGLKKAQKVFFQNADNRDFMITHRVVTGSYDLLPGSGVNLERYHVLPYPTGEEVNFMYFARVMKEKGIEQFVDAAKVIKNKYPNIRFHVCGTCEQGYEDKIKQWVKEGVLIYHGQVKNIPEMHAISQCTIHPSFYPEGLSNVLLESSACGRPIITTDRSGCREVIDDGVNGFIVKQRDSRDLVEKIERFLNLSWEEKRNMGMAGRIKVEENFDRNIVIHSYKKELRKIDK